MLTVTEFEFAGHPSCPQVIAPRSQLASTSLAPTASSAPVCTLNDRTRFIVLASEVNCRVNLSGAADANSMPVLAGKPFILAVNGGEIVNCITY
jgi:hypothetical protein